MEKIYSLKKWLTLDDATKCIGSILGAPEFSKADLYQLVLDSKLKMSINFVNHAKACLGEFIDLPEGFDFNKDMISASPVLHWVDAPQFTNEKNPPLCMSRKLNNNQYTTFSESVKTISGIWDLMMLGNEKIHIEFELHQLTSGIEVELCNLDGTFFVSPDEAKIASLQHHYEDNEFCFGSEAYRKLNLTNMTEKGYDPVEAAEMTHKWSDAREKLKQSWYENPRSAYYPAGGIDDDSVLVVRIDAIHEFEKNLHEPKNKVEQNTINPRLETTYQNIIGALLDLIKNKKLPNKPTQEWIIGELENSGLDGTSRSKLSTLFPVAKKSFNTNKNPN